MHGRELLKYILTTDNTRCKTSLLQLARDHFNLSQKTPQLLCDFFATIRWLLRAIDYSLSEKQVELSPYTFLYGNDLHLYGSKVLAFARLLEQCGLEPVFLVNCPPHEPQPSQAKLDDFGSTSSWERSKVAAIHQVCEGVESFYKVHWRLSEFSALHIKGVLQQAGVKIIHLTEELVSEVSTYCSQHDEVCGVLSNDIDLVTLQGLKVFLPEQLELVRLSPQGDQDLLLEIFCGYVTSSILATSLGIKESQISQLVALCDNAGSYNSLCALLKLPDAQVTTMAEWLRGREKPLLDCPELEGFFEENPSYRHCVQITLANGCSEAHTESSVVAFVQECVRNGSMAPHLLAIANGCYWRPVLCESQLIQSPCFVDITLRIRERLYSLLGVKEYREFGCSYRSSFTVVSGQVESQSLNKDALLSLTRDPVSKRLSFLLHTVLGMQAPEESDDDVQLDQVLSSGTSVQIIVAAVMSCLAVLFMSTIDLCTPSPALAVCELDALLLTSLVSLTHVPVGQLTDRPSSRSITVLAWFTHVLQQCFMASSFLHLSDLLPLPGDIFSPQKFLFLHKECFSCDDKEEGLFGLKPFVSLKAEILNESSNLWTLVGLFVDSLEAVKTAASSEVFSSSGRDEDNTLLCISIPCPMSGEGAERSPVSHNTSTSSDGSAGSFVLNQDLELSAVQEHKALEENIYFSLNGFNEEPSTCDESHSDWDTEVSMPTIESSAAAFQTDPETLTQPSSRSRRKKHASRPRKRHLQDIVTKLPILEHKQKILELVDKHMVVMIEGETGCGKSTMVPQFILDQCLQEEKPCKIAVTQPRRVAAMRLAERVAMERREEVGGTVGYCIGGESQRTPRTAITYCTVGYFLQMLLHDPLLLGEYTHIIIDEIHERCLSTEFTLLVVRKLASKLPKIKIILMSATLQGDMFVYYFDQTLHFSKIAPSYFVGAKRYPVQTYFMDELLDLTDQSMKSIWHGKELQALANLRALILGMPPMRVHEERKAKSVVTELAMSVSTELVVSQGSRGEGILIFLPGISEITCYQDLLTQELRSRGIERYFTIFVLHSQVPLEEQTEIFEDPPPNKVHVILATNIAESSITLPKLRLVINFGLYRQLQYDSRRRLSCLKKCWCSRASCAQRAGRVGRVFEGVAIHLFTKRFYRLVLPEFNPPEMVTAPLAKLVLQAKSIGSKLDMSTPSEVLRQAIEPPSLEQLETALKDLADLGAIVSHPLREIDETVEMTLLGEFSLSFTMDIDLCRLVLYGVFFGVSTEAIVIAAEMSLPNDVFSLPSRHLIQDEKKFYQGILRSLDTRVRCDRGDFSDHLAICRMFQEWISCRNENIERSKPYSRWFLLRKFCKTYAVRSTRLMLLETTVAVISTRLLSCIPSDCEIYDSIKTLSNINQYLELTSTEKLEVQFTDDVVQVKTLVAAAFAHQMILGRPEVKSRFTRLKDKATSELTFLQKADIHPKKCIVMRGVGRGIIEPLHQLVDLLLPGIKCDITVDSGTAYLHFPKLKVCSSCRTNTPSLLTGTSCLRCKLPECWQQFVQELSVFSRKMYRELLIVWQFSEKKTTWSVEGIDAHFSRLEHPLALSWVNLSAKKEMIGISSFRNPTAFVCDFSHRNLPYLAVATSLQGVEHSMFIAAQKITILPNIASSPLALLITLAFQSLSSHLELLVDRESKAIHGFKINSQEIVFGDFQTLTVSDLVRINILRKALSKALTEVPPNGRLPSDRVACVSQLLRSVLSQNSIRIEESNSEGTLPVGQNVCWERLSFKELADDAYECDSEFGYDESTEGGLSNFKYYPTLNCSLLSTVSFDVSQVQKLMAGAGPSEPPNLTWTLNLTQDFKLSPLAKPFVPVISNSDKVPQVIEPASDSQRDTTNTTESIPGLSVNHRGTPQPADNAETHTTVRPPPGLSVNHRGTPQPADNTERNTAMGLPPGFSINHRGTFHPADNTERNAAVGPPPGLSVNHRGTPQPADNAETHTTVRPPPGLSVNHRGTPQPADNTERNTAMGLPPGFSINHRGTSHPADNTERNAAVGPPPGLSVNHRGTPHPADNAETHTTVRPPPGLSVSHRGTPHPADNTERNTAMGPPPGLSVNHRGTPHPAGGHAHESPMYYDPFYAHVLASRIPSWCSFDQACNFIWQMGIVVLNKWYQSNFIAPQGSPEAQASQGSPQAQASQVSPQSLTSQMSPQSQDTQASPQSQLSPPAYRTQSLYGYPQQQYPPFYQGSPRGLRPHPPEVSRSPLPTSASPVNSPPGFLQRSPGGSSMQNVPVSVTMGTSHVQPPLSTAGKSQRTLSPPTTWHRSLLPVPPLTPHSVPVQHQHFGSTSVPPPRFRSISSQPRPQSSKCSVRCADPEHRDGCPAYNPSNSNVAHHLLGYRTHQNFHGRSSQNMHPTPPPNSWSSSMRDPWRHTPRRTQMLPAHYRREVVPRSTICKTVASQIPSVQETHLNGQKAHTEFHPPTSQEALVSQQEPHSTRGLHVSPQVILSEAPPSAKAKEELTAQEEEHTYDAHKHESHVPIGGDTPSNDVPELEEWSELATEKGSLQEMVQSVAQQDSLPEWNVVKSSHVVETGGLQETIQSVPPQELQVSVVLPESTSLEDSQAVSFGASQETLQSLSSSQPEVVSDAASVSWQVHSSPSQKEEKKRKQETQPVSQLEEQVFVSDTLPETSSLQLSQQHVVVSEAMTQQALPTLPSPVVSHGTLSGRAQSLPPQESAVVSRGTLSGRARSLPPQDTAVVSHGTLSGRARSLPPQDTAVVSRGTLSGRARSLPPQDTAVVSRGTLSGRARSLPPQESAVVSRGTLSGRAQSLPPQESAVVSRGTLSGRAQSLPPQESAVVSRGTLSGRAQSLPPQESAVVSRGTLSGRAQSLPPQESAVVSRGTLSGRARSLPPQESAVVSRGTLSGRARSLPPQETAVVSHGTLSGRARSLPPQDTAVVSHGTLSGRARSLPPQDTAVVNRGTLSGRVQFLPPQESAVVSHGTLSGRVQSLPPQESAVVSHGTLSGRARSLPPQEFPKEPHPVSCGAPSRMVQSLLLQEPHPVSRGALSERAQSLPPQESGTWQESVRNIQELPLQRPSQGSQEAPIVPPTRGSHPSHLPRESQPHSRETPSPLPPRRSTQSQSASSKSQKATSRPKKSKRKRKVNSPKPPPFDPPMPKSVPRYQSPEMFVNSSFGGAAHRNIQCPTNLARRQRNRLLPPIPSSFIARYSPFAELNPPLPIPNPSVSSDGKNPDVHRAVTYLAWCALGQQEGRQQRSISAQHSFPEDYGISNDDAVGFFVSLLYCFFKSLEMKTICSFYYFRLLEIRCVAFSVLAPLSSEFFTERNADKFFVFTRDDGTQCVSSKFQSPDQSDSPVSEEEGASILLKKEEPTGREVNIVEEAASLVAKVLRIAQTTLRECASYPSVDIAPSVKSEVVCEDATGEVVCRAILTDIVTNLGSGSQLAESEVTMETRSKPVDLDTLSAPESENNVCVVVGDPSLRELNDPPLRDVSDPPLWEESDPLISEASDECSTLDVDIGSLLPKSTMVVEGDYDIPEETTPTVTIESSVDIEVTPTVRAESESVGRVEAGANGASVVDGSPPHGVHGDDTTNEITPSDDLITADDIANQIAPDHIDDVMGTGDETTPVISDDIIGRDSTVNEGAPVHSDDIISTDHMADEVTPVPSNNVTVVEEETTDTIEVVPVIIDSVGVGSECAPLAVEGSMINVEDQEPRDIAVNMDLPVAETSSKELLLGEESLGIYKVSVVGCGTLDVDVVSMLATPTVVIEKGDGTEEETIPTVTMEMPTVTMQSNVDIHVIATPTVMVESGSAKRKEAGVICADEALPAMGSVHGDDIITTDGIANQFAPDHGDDIISTDDMTGISSVLNNDIATTGDDTANQITPPDIDATNENNSVFVDDVIDTDDGANEITPASSDEVTEVGDEAVDIEVAPVISDHKDCVCARCVPVCNLPLSMSDQNSGGMDPPAAETSSQEPLLGISKAPLPGEDSPAIYDMSRNAARAVSQSLSPESLAPSVSSLTRLDMDSPFDEDCWNESDAPAFLRLQEEPRTAVSQEPPARSIIPLKPPIKILSRDLKEKTQKGSPAEKSRVSMDGLPVEKSSHSQKGTSEVSGAVEKSSRSQKGPRRVSAEKNSVEKSVSRASREESWVERPPRKAKRQHRTSGSRFDGGYPVHVAGWEMLDVHPQSNISGSLKTADEEARESKSISRGSSVETESNQSLRSSSTAKSLERTTKTVPEGPGAGSLSHFISYAENVMLASVETRVSFSTICVQYRQKFRVSRDIWFEEEDVEGQSDVFSVKKCRKRAYLFQNPPKEEGSRVRFQEGEVPRRESSHGSCQRKERETAGQRHGDGGRVFRRSGGRRTMGSRQSQRTSRKGD